MKIPQIKTLDSYFIRTFLFFFFSCYITFIFLYIIGTIVADPNYAREGFVIVLKYYLFLLPPISYLITAPTILLATLFTFSSFSKNTELVAIQAAGVSSYRLFTLLTVLALIIGTSILFVSDRLVSKYFKKALYIKQVHIKKNKNFSFMRTNKIWYRSNNFIYKIDTFDPQNNIFYGMTLYTLDDDFNLIQRLDAQKCYFENNLWIAQNGTEVNILKGSKFPDISSFEKKILPIKEKPDDFEVVSKINYGFFSIGELKQIIENHKNLGVPTKFYETQLHSKFSFVLTIILMIFLGIPFAFTGLKKSTYVYDVVLCLGISALFWFFQSAIGSFGSSGILNPFVAAWLPNGLFLLIGLELFRRKKQQWQF